MRRHKPVTDPNLAVAIRLHGTGPQPTSTVRLRAYPAEKDLKALGLGISLRRTRVGHRRLLLTGRVRMMACAPWWSGSGATMNGSSKPCASQKMKLSSLAYTASNELLTRVSI